MRDFIEKLTLAIAPLVVGHMLDVRKARVVAPAPPVESFAAYVKVRRS